MLAPSLFLPWGRNGRVWKQLWHLPFFFRGKEKRKGSENIVATLLIFWPHGSGSRFLRDATLKAQNYLSFERRRNAGTFHYMDSPLIGSFASCDARKRTQ